MMNYLLTGTRYFSWEAYTLGRVTTGGASVQRALFATYLSNKLQSWAGVAFCLENARCTVTSSILRLRDRLSADRTCSFPLSWNCGFSRRIVLNEKFLTLLTISNFGNCKDGSLARHSGLEGSSGFSGCAGFRLNWFSGCAGVSVAPGFSVTNWFSEWWFLRVELSFQLSWFLSSVCRFISVAGFSRLKHGVSVE